MGKRTLELNERLYDYLLAVSLRDTPVQAALRAETDQLEMARMQVSADQAQFMALLVKLIGARRVIEVGTFTGYSALTLAQALPDDGRLIACDVSKEWTDIAKRYWQQAGVADKIELRLAPALETLDTLIADRQGAHFDFAFIDADKQNQRNYYERCLELMRPGGLIAVDNVLWGGSVADPENNQDDTRAIRDFNEFVYQDTRVDISLVPIGDGVTLARKRA
ncbi:SAM-dependent methyltransferase [Candidatus Tenderia electrophaga]|jgi:predicted O-methyltransferase YrrM|uniref:SAM-dependent methyltransferase n=1 Tax=Candidatus Tenderia electrophaga TaxID=1748243 RepID=A0A0S2T9H9_9GAMM|nr:SAM-dependent methyltransferase [Candidatus Tenderia electrophaga]